LLRLVAAGLPIVGLAVLLIVAIWAMLQLRSASVRSRRDLPFAFVVAAVVGVAAGGFVLAVGVGFASMDTSGPTPAAYLSGLPIGLGIGTLVTIASFAGYAMLARTPLAKAALVGALLGPAVLFALAGGAGRLVWLAGGTADEIEANQAAADLAARSSVLQLTVSDVQVTTGGGGSIVTAVRLRATVHATQEVRLATGGKTPWPQFSLIEEGNHEPLGGPTPTGPAILATGSTTTYDLFFQATQLFFGPPAAHHPRLDLRATDPRELGAPYGPRRRGRCAVRGHDEGGHRGEPLRNERSQAQRSYPLQGAPAAGVRGA
jgi:hypothetical protein